MALFVNLQNISLRELMEIASDNKYSLAYTPFGKFGIRTYIRRAAPWKGVKKRPDETLDDYVKRIAEKYTKKGSFNGLKKAVEISQKFKDKEGVALVRVGKFYEVMPYKAALQMIEAGKISPEDIVAKGDSYMDLVGVPEFKEYVSAGKLLAPVVY